MEMSLFKKNGKTFTKFRVKLKEFNFYRVLLEIKYCIDTSAPVKKSSKFIYFEKEGDWINDKTN